WGPATADVADDQGFSVGQAEDVSGVDAGVDAADDQSLERGHHRRGRREAVPGQVRGALVAAGLELARAGGPDAVVLREAPRRVGVVPNAAYRHFADRDALLADVGVAAMGELARRMREHVAAVPEHQDPKETALARLGALGEAYLEFAMDETGLFETAFAVPRHLEYAAGTAGEGLGPLPVPLLRAAPHALLAAAPLPP